MSKENDAYVKFVEDEDIYIECKPVDITGEVITDEDVNLPENINNEVLESISESLSGDNLHVNVGFQLIIGLGILAALYGLGNFLFKDIPKKILKD